MYLSGIIGYITQSPVPQSHPKVGLRWFWRQVLQSHQQTYNPYIIPVSDDRKGGQLPRSFYEVSITSIPKLTRTRQDNYLLTTLKNVGARFLGKILANLIQQRNKGNKYFA